MQWGQKAFSETVGPLARKGEWNILGQTIGATGGVSRSVVSQTALQNSFF